MSTHDQLRQVIIDDIREYRPDDAAFAEQIADHLLVQPILQTDVRIAAFIVAYKRALRNRDAWASLIESAKPTA